MLEKPAILQWADSLPIIVPEGGSALAPAAQASSRLRAAQAELEGTEPNQPRSKKGRRALLHQCTELPRAC